MVHPHPAPPARPEPPTGPGVTERDEAPEHEGPIEHLVDAVKPRLRGWMHVVLFPLSLVAGIVLTVLAEPGRARAGAVVFTVTAALLFGTSGIYHRGSWSPKWHGILKRIDHANIFLIIAGTHTPFALCLLPPDQGRVLLISVWLAALAGVFLTTVWVTAPRWVSTPVYIGIGWIAVFFFQPLLAGGGPLVMTLIVAGGVLYTVGGVVYALRRPDPWPRWFGFHEVFHALTVAGFILHFIAAALSVEGYVPAPVG